MSIASIITRGFSGGVNFIPTRGFLSGVAPSSGPSGIRRLALSELQNHPQVRWENYKRKKKLYDEEEATLALLAGMIDDFFD